MTGSDNSSQLHQASSNVSGSRQSASKFKLGGLTDAPPSGPFKLPKHPSIAPLGHIPLSSLLSKKSSAISQATKVDAGDTQSGTTRPSDGAASSMCSGPQIDASDVPEHVTSNNNVGGHDDTNNHGPNSGQGAASIHGPTTPYDMAALTTFTAYPARCHWMQSVSTKTVRNGNESPITVPRLMTHSVVADDSMVLLQATRFLEHLTTMDTFSYLALVETQKMKTCWNGSKTWM